MNLQYRESKSRALTIGLLPFGIVIIVYHNIAEKSIDN